MGIKLPHNVTISTATSPDIPALSGLLALLFEQETEFVANPVVQQRGLREIIANPEIGRILVANADTQIAGMVSVLFSISTALGGRVAWLEDMIVHPDWRHQGIGSALLKRALDVCQTEGCQRITLLSDGDNLTAQRFYQKHGFSVSEMRPMRCLLKP